MRTILAAVLLSGCATFGLSSGPPPSCRSSCAREQSQCQSSESTRAAFARQRADYGHCSGSYSACVAGCQ